jgi:hypothetical protein
MKKIVLLMPYYGRWPEWFNLFIETCKWNPTINWIFFTDLEQPRNRCGNVQYVRMSLSELLELASSRLGFTIDFTNPYKLCDLRPGFGVIFDAYIAGADYFGWGDIDVVYGDIRKFVTDEVLRYDVISFHGGILSNSFCLFRNIDAVKEKYKIKDLWKQWVNVPTPQGLDEMLLFAFDMRSNYFVESYCAPNAPTLATFTGPFGDSVNYAPGWKDGSLEFPKEWRWKEGRLTNDKTGSEEFQYLHFAAWKGITMGFIPGSGQWKKLSKLVHFDDRHLSGGWKINEGGFWPFDDALESRLRVTDSMPVVSEHC